MAGLDEHPAEKLSRAELLGKIDNLVAANAELNNELALAEVRVTELENFIARHGFDPDFLPDVPTVEGRER
jgi:hypothetical protein